MTIHLLFVTISIERHRTTAQEIEDRSRVKALTERLSDQKCEHYLY